MRKRELVLQAVNAPPAQLGLDREINDLRGLIEKLQGFPAGFNLDEWD